MDESFKNMDVSDINDGDVKQQTMSVLKSGELRKKLQIANVQKSSPTSLLARNTVLLPSGVMRADDWINPTPNTSKFIPKSTLDSKSVLNTCSSGSATVWITERIF